jgi:RHS repeat-associated protein
MGMPGRKFNNGDGYRYGFNGKEKDNEISGEGNSYDYGERMYDPRLGKFLSIDKYTHKQPYYSPYIYAGNKPIWCIDKDGNQEVIVTIYEKQKDGTLLQTGVCFMTINTVEEAKGIERDAVRVNVVYEWGQVVKSINPFDYYVEKVALSIANLWGAVDLTKGSKDELYGYDREASGEYITEDRANMYIISGSVKAASTIVTGGTAAATNKVASWGAWQIADMAVDGLVQKMGDWGLGEKGNNLLYSTLKSGKAFYDAVTGKNLVTALDLASQLADTGLKGEALMNELSKRGVNMSGNVAKDKNEAVNKALETFKQHYQTNGNAAQIQ